MSGAIAKAVGLDRASTARAAAIEGLVNFVLPFVIYELARRPFGDVRALLAASAPPIVWSLVEFARKRRIDAVSMLVIAGIALSLLAFIGGGGARFLQLRENLVTGLIGAHLPGLGGDPPAPGLSARPRHA